MPNLPFPYNGFVGGLDLTAPAYDTDDNGGASPDLLNVNANLYGALSKRAGARQLNSAFGAFPKATSLYGWQGHFALSSANPTLVVAGGNSTYLFDPATNAASSLVSGLHADTRWSFVEAPTSTGGSPDSTVLGVNGVDPPQAYTNLVAATWAKSSGAVDVPNGRYMVYSGNQVFMAGLGAAPAGETHLTDDWTSRVYASAIGDPYNWDIDSQTGAAFIDFLPDNGEPVTGLGVVGGYVLVFKPSKTWVIVDMQSNTVRKISNVVGTYAHRSIHQGPGPQAFFVSRDRGIYETNGSSLTPVSDKVLPVFADYLVAPGAYFNSHYYSSQQGLVMDLDLQLNSWWRHNFTYPINDFAILSDALYAVDTRGNVVQLFTGSSDYGADIAWHWFAPWQSPSFYRRRRFPTPYYRKRLRQVRTRGLGKIGLTCAYDFQNNAGNPETGVFAVTNDMFASSSLPSLQKFYGFGVANGFQMQFSGADQNPATLIEYTLMLNDRTDQIPA
jgi:hypothetical protein